MPVFLLDAYTVERELVSSLVSSYQGKILIHEGSSLMTSSPPEAPPPNTIIMGLWFQHRIWESTNIQSIARAHLDAY